jgi:hypothetical protein
MLQKTIIFTLALFLAGCGEKDEKANSIDTNNAINLEAIAKSEDVHGKCEQDILALIKSDGMISVQTGKAFTQLNLKKGESNGNIPVVYLEEDIKGDVAQFIKQYSTDLFVLGYSVAGLLDQASRNSPDPIQTYVESVESLAELDELKTSNGDENWLKTNIVTYINAQQKDENGKPKWFWGATVLKMLGYAYFQSGILAYLYGYIKHYGINCEENDLLKFNSQRNNYRYADTFKHEAYGSEGDNDYYSSHYSEVIVRYLYDANNMVNPKAEKNEKGMNIVQATKLNEKIKKMHVLGEYAYTATRCSYGELKLKTGGIPENIPGVFSLGIRSEDARTALCIPTPESLQGKLSGNAIKIVTDIRKDLQTSINK